VIERARTAPPLRVLDTIRQQNISVQYTQTETQGDIVQRGEAALRGEASLPGFLPVKIDFPFSAANLDIGSPTVQLFVASLASADALLRAYRQSSSVKYLGAAEEELLAFERLDRRSIVPHAFLWNDHALAARIAVFADYWSLVRERTDLDPERAREFLSLVKRTAERLASPSLYTFRSNHGAMQNLALLQVAAAFPFLDTGGAYRRLGCARIAEQLGYYVSPEGPVLEHSAGYHVLGSKLLLLARDLTALAECPEKIDWHRQLRLADAFSDLLRRPDGSLPAYGNTIFSDESAIHPLGAGVAQPPASPVNIFPVAGHAIWWDGLRSWPDATAMSQTVMTWSNFPSRAHKLADDMSVILWSGGFTWITNVGYWPYGADGERDARQWRGSNAPFQEGEPLSEPGSTILRGQSANERVRIVDMERSVAQGGTVRRTVIDIDGLLWLVADLSAAKKQASVERVWTAPPGISSSTLPGGDILLRAPAAQQATRMSFLGDAKPAPQPLKGSIHPFGGWIVGGKGPTPATSWVVAQPASDSLAVTVFARGDTQALETAVPPVLARDKGTGGFVATFATGYGAQRVAWDGKTLRVAHTDATTSTLEPLPPPAEARSTRDAIVASYAAAAAKYKRLPELTPYRKKISLALLVVLAVQELGFFGLRRALPAQGAAWDSWLRVASIIGWLALAGLIDFWYLA
jgi:hypothetical protein